MIVLTTDLGHLDPYVGIMKGVILSIAPDARIVDLTHEIRAHGIREACMTLMVSRRFFPRGTIFVTVVDPGVGTARPILWVGTREHSLLAPDNGVLSFLGGREIAAMRRVRNPKLFLRPVSSTFHGRDIFAPVAARLERGLDPARLGPKVSSMVRIEMPVPRVADGVVRGQVVWVDRFGNLVTNIGRSLARGRVEVRVAGRNTRRMVKTYGDAPKGSLVALIGSGELLEISLVEGNAAGALGVGIGETVEVRRR